MQKGMEMVWWLKAEKRSSMCEDPEVGKSLVELEWEGQENLNRWVSGKTSQAVAGEVWIWNETLCLISVDYASYPRWLEFVDVLNPTRSLWFKKWKQVKAGELYTETTVNAAENKFISEKQPWKGSILK